jgi:enamine deaminase RidA (YjgF/YER057c/UK114 family)
MEKRRISSGTEWEAEVGYSRAVRVDNEIHVSGTTATDDEGNIVGEDDPYRQTEQTLSNIADALEEAGATLDDVIRTRMYVVDIEDWEDIGRAHGEVFSTARPATSMVEVERLIDPEMLVEIEAVARVAD